MSLKISQILNEIILTEEDGSIFTDYAPVYVLNTPTKTKFKLSTVGDTELEGTIQLLDTEHQRLTQGKPLDYYTFELVIDDETRTIQLSGKEINRDGSPSLYKNVPYNFIFGDDLIKGDDNTNYYNGSDIEDVNNELKDLKIESETFKVISKYKDDPEFQKIFLDSFISGTKGIKMNQKPITDTLRDLRKNGLLEADGPMSGRKRNYLKLKLGLQKFINQLFKLFAKLHKSGRNSITYTVIKKFYKQLFFIITKGQSNISDQKTRDKLWKQLLGNFSDLLKGLGKSRNFVKGKGGKKSQQNENFILEEIRKEQITFTDFGVSDQQVEDGMEDINLEDKLDVSDITPDEVQKMNDLAFLLYGKDVGRLLPRYAKKYPGIGKMFGLLKKGGYETSLEKSKEKWGVSRFDFSGEGDDVRSMKNLPMFNVQFESPLNYDDGEGNKLKINKDDILKFNYDKNNKVLIHRISKKVNTNISQIYLKMDRTPELDKEYNTRLVKVVPKSGQVFDVETTKGYGVKIKLIEPIKK